MSEALHRLSIEELHLLKSAGEGHKAGRSFTDDERTALRAYGAAALIGAK